MEEKVFKIGDKVFYQEIASLSDTFPNYKIVEKTIDFCEYMFGEDPDEVPYRYWDGDYDLYPKRVFSTYEEAYDNVLEKYTEYEKGLNEAKKLFLKNNS